MAMILSGKIDVKKIDKSRLFVGEKGTYLEVTIVVNDEVDAYGNCASVAIGQTSEERQAKAPKVFLGNLKTVWRNDAPATSVASDTNRIAAQMDEDLPF